MADYYGTPLDIRQNKKTGARWIQYNPKLQDSNYINFDDPRPYKTYDNDLSMHFPVQTVRDIAKVAKARNFDPNIPLAISAKESYGGVMNIHGQSGRVSMEDSARYAYRNPGQANETWNQKSSTYNKRAVPITKKYDEQFKDYETKLGSWSEERNNAAKPTFVRALEYMGLETPKDRVWDKNLESEYKTAYDKGKDTFKRFERIEMMLDKVDRTIKAAGGNVERGLGAYRGVNFGGGKQADQAGKDTNWLRKGVVAHPRFQEILKEEGWDGTRWTE